MEKGSEVVNPFGMWFIVLLLLSTIVCADDFIHIELPIDKSAMEFRYDEIIGSSSHNNLVYFLERSNFSGMAKPGHLNGAMQVVTSWSPETFERKIIYRSTQLPNSARLMSIDNDTLYYLELSGPGWILKSKDLLNSGNTTTIGSMKTGVPLVVKVVPKRQIVFVVVESGVHQLSIDGRKSELFIEADIRSQASSSMLTALSDDEKHFAVASGLGWVYLFDINGDEIRKGGFRDFTLGLPRFPREETVKDWNAFSAKWGAVQITAIGFRGDDLLIGTWGGRLIALNLIDLATTYDAPAPRREGYFKGIIRGIFNTPKYLFLTLEGGGVWYFPNDKYISGYQQHVLPDLDVQLGEVINISNIGDSAFSLLGKTREVARVICCESYSLVARDTPLPGGGRVTIVREGYFDLHSVQSSKFDGISYKFGKRKGSILEIFDVLYRPDIVSRKLKGENIEAFVGQLTIEKALNSPPPSIGTLSAPKAEITTERISIPYTIKSEGGGVGEVLVLHNGKLIKSDGYYKDAPGSTMVAMNTTKASSAGEVAKGVQKMLGSGESTSASINRDSVVVRQAKPKTLNAAGEYSDSVEIDVIPGEENEITVMARNQDNTILGQGQTVRFKSSLPKADPHLWILPVGIASFQDRGVSKLASPKKDALDFACNYGGKDALKRASVNCDKPGYANSLFKSSNIHVIDPLTNEKATRANILAKLDEIATKAKPTDTFIWFVSSHGTMDANSVYGIVPFDAKCQGPKCEAASGLVSSNDILEKSKAIKAMKQLLILDTCNAGGLDNKMSGLYDARMSGLAKNMGLHLYAAATSTEFALDGQDANKNSIFTATLLEGLSGASPKDSEGRISIIPLGQYVKTNTAEASRKAYADIPPPTPVIQHFGKDAPLAGVSFK